VELAPDIARVAGLIGDPVRASMLAALIDGRALPAGELAFIGNVSPQTASFHLKKLLEASLVGVERQGKHSYYRLTDESVAAVLEGLAGLGAVRRQIEVRARMLPSPARSTDVRFARSCYGHLAGKLAVDLHEALVRGQLLESRADRGYALTSGGRAWFDRLGVVLPAAARHAEHESRACIDWTERRHHLGGPLGVALFSRMKDLKWLVANPTTRAVRVTDLGARALSAELSIRL
jgi:DNA-binding transcriptional ArsR family regulator